MPCGAGGKPNTLQSSFRTGNRRKNMKKGITITIICVLAVAAIALGMLYYTSNEDKTKQIKTLMADADRQADQIERLSADVEDKALQIVSLDAEAADRSAQIETLNADAAEKAAQWLFLIAASNPAVFNNKKRQPPHGGCLFWRRRWDSNPRNIAVQLISSQPRYDRFDTSPGRG